MLYMPRGTIHQAVAQEADSVHLTISTYQRWNHGELAARMMSHAAASTRLLLGLVFKICPTAEDWQSAVPNEDIT